MMMIVLAIKSNLFAEEPSAEDIVDIVRRPEHSSNIVAMDTSANLRVFVTCR